jgi:hypothetical protein
MEERGMSESKNMNTNIWKPLVVRTGIHSKIPFGCTKQYKYKNALLL